MNDKRITLKVIAISEDLEKALRNGIVSDHTGTKLALAPEIVKSIFSDLSEKEEILLRHGFRGIPVICRPDIRLYFRRLIEKNFPRTQVLSYL